MTTLPTSPPIDPANPWPGLATFTEEQSAYFFGRDAEARELTRRLERKTLTILFGQSGLGKSSLLQAGVFPRLRAEGYCPVYLRLDHNIQAAPLAEQIKVQELPA
jgi:ABC-type cobalamin/Fe3+-siderophores transport system ATPase subunit